jgi:hypothetical protein
MPNKYRGEIDAELGGRRRTLVLTLRAASPARWSATSSTASCSDPAIRMWSGLGSPIST